MDPLTAFLTDNTNCGSCGVKCGSNQTCQAGEFQPELNNRPVVVGTAEEGGRNPIASKVAHTVRLLSLYRQMLPHVTVPSVDPVPQYLCGPPEQHPELRCGAPACRCSWGEEGRGTGGRTYSNVLAGLLGGSVASLTNLDLLQILTDAPQAPVASNAPGEARARTVAACVLPAPPSAGPHASTRKRRCATVDPVGEPAALRTPTRPARLGCAPWQPVTSAGPVATATRATAARRGWTLSSTAGRVARLAPPAPPAWAARALHIGVRLVAARHVAVLRAPPPPHASATPLPSRVVRLPARPSFTHAELDNTGDLTNLGPVSTGDSVSLRGGWGLLPSAQREGGHQRCPGHQVLTAPFWFPGQP